MPQPLQETERASLAPLVVRGVAGGALMGLANLVPGISGGTMLLATGVYPRFVEGVAEVTTLKFRPRTLIVLASIAGAAALAIVLLAGLVKGLVIDHRWVMYSLFIGLTLGGVPVVWRLLGRLKSPAVAGCVAGVAVMALLAMAQPGVAGAADAGAQAYLMLFVAGLAGASAMILPGVSGGYLLLILGQYIIILSAIDDAKTSLQAADWAQLTGAMHVFVPVGLGVVAGVAVVSNLIALLLRRYKQPTLGVLLGLLLGAVLGLWPFQQGVPPRPGEIIRGRVMTPELVAGLDPKYYPLERFTPGASQVAASLGLVLGGFLVTHGVALLGRPGKEQRG